MAWTNVCSHLHNIIRVPLTQWSVAVLVSEKNAGSK